MVARNDISPGAPANAALRAYVERLARGGAHADALVSAAEAVSADPWEVVRCAGLLARCRVEIADRDLGLTADLRVRSADAATAVVRVPAGARYPVLDHVGRRRRGAFDTPAGMARRVVAAARDAAEGPVRRGVDTACGTGAFLVALTEIGVREVVGTDLDEGALAVARLAAPRARLSVADGLKGGPEADLVVGNPPYVPPERQDRALRAELRRRFPWLRGRFDLVVPFAATAVDRCRAGGGVGLVLPSAALVQPYGAVLRRRWVERHRITDLIGPWPFPGASVDVTLTVLRKGGGPAPLPRGGISPTELLRLDAVPINADLAPGDVDLVERIRSRSVPLGELCVVDTGLVAHGPLGGKARLLSDDFAVGRVPYADAKDFFEGRRRWLDYRPHEMHRPKRREMFEDPKIVVQRIRGRAPVRAAVDFDGVYVGHTCTVVWPQRRTVPLPRLLELVRSPLVDGLTRIERGARLDLYPKDVAAIPVPRVWLERPHVPLERAFGLDTSEIARLTALAAR